MAGHQHGIKSREIPKLKRNAEKLCIRHNLVSGLRIKAEALWRLREQRASETPQISVCLRRLAVRPRQASSRSDDA
ncbi:hypothetical protein NBRC111894_2241 [Sporolactobacillus inulinus]|uniref:Uncharacterized protein n=1 Tax=Sporolactobacillus inulinus TaxID=2078 RepID=A0A4Y1ZC92_9BACL|nr:hypothetical protein NBRC111894_2241 [Sporolactobacillus inulinus]